MADHYIFQKGLWNASVFLCWYFEMQFILYRPMQHVEC